MTQNLEAVTAEIDAMPELGQRPTRLDFEDGRIDDLLDNPPPPMEWLVKDRLPAKVVGTVAAPGGTGKGWLTLQLAVSLATGLDWLGMDVDHPCRVLLLSAEDSRDDLHRRLHAVKKHYSAYTGHWAKQEALLRENLRIIDRVGHTNQLTARFENSNLSCTPLVQHIADEANKWGGVKLIIADPLARFSGGDENRNEDATRLVEALERIRKQTGATVLAPHHVHKGAGRDQTAARGASGLVDGMRWMALMQTMHPDECKKFGVDVDLASRFVWFGTVKANHVKPWPGVWLKRQDDGVLVPADIKPVPRRQSDPEQVRRETDQFIERLTGIIRQHGPMTSNRIESQYSGVDNPLGVGQKKARAMIEQAISEGHLIEIPKGNSRLIALPGMTLPEPSSTPAESGKKSGNRQPAESGKSNVAGIEPSNGGALSPANGKSVIAGIEPSNGGGWHPAKSHPYGEAVSLPDCSHRDGYPSAGPDFEEF